MPITTDINTFTANYHTNRMATLKNRLKDYTADEIQEILQERIKESFKQYCCKICKEEFMTNDTECEGVCCVCQDDVVESIKIEFND